MLERAAGCLETGSLRRLLPLSKNSIKSRRALHSGFWGHGASGNELYPLWMLMVRSTECTGLQQDEKRAETNPGGLLFDFLYPAGTINLIRKYSFWGGEQQEGRWPRPGQVKRVARGYASSSKPTSSSCSKKRTEDIQDSRDKFTMYKDMESLYKKLNVEKSIDFEEARRKFGRLQPEEQIPLRKLLMEFLSTSDRTIDAEFVTELFNLLTQDERDGRSAQVAIICHLKLRNLSEAITIHESSVANLGTPAGLAEILGYLVANQLWSDAFKLWKSSETLRERPRKAVGYNIYEVVDTLPTIGRLAQQLVSFVNSTIEASPEHQSASDTLNNGISPEHIDHGTSVAFPSNGEGRNSNMIIVEPHEPPLQGSPQPCEHDAKSAENDANNSEDCSQCAQGLGNNCAHSSLAITSLRSTTSTDRNHLANMSETSIERNTEQSSLEGYTIASPGTGLDDLPISYTVSTRPVALEYDVDVLAAHSDLTRFARSIVRRALFGPQTFHGPSFMGLLKALRRWQLASSSIYEQAIALLFDSGNTRLIPRCYALARTSTDYSLSERALNTVLRRFCADHNTEGMKMVLDDFFTLHAKPNRTAYRMCLREFSHQGDVKTVHALFEQYSARFLRQILSKKKKKNLTSKLHPAAAASDLADDYIPVLHVHAKRGEVAEVQRILEEMEHVHHLRPSIKCRNILLNAFVKVQRYDDAYQCFEDILNDTSLTPNSYTIGTMLGACASQGDLESAVELNRLAQDLGIEKTIPMIDSMVLTNIRDDKLKEAEEICIQTAEAQDIEGPKTRMWNQLLLEYALRRELDDLNRILQRMSSLGVHFDEYTYAMLMQALAMVGQANGAWKILKEVMPEAGVKPGRVHYAIVMGGYINTREYSDVFRVHARMQQAGIKVSASTSRLAMKATASKDRVLYAMLPVEQQVHKALKMFMGTMSSMNVEDIINLPKSSDLPLDIAYSSMFYSYMIFVLGSCKEFKAATDAYEAYRTLLPEGKQDPIPVLTALMSVALRASELDKVEAYWDQSFSQAVERGTPLKMAPSLRLGNKDGPTDVLRRHQLTLSRPLRLYMQALMQQKRHQQLAATVKQVVEAGFVVDNRNWNMYIEYLARSWKYPKDAFTLCEAQLMPRWTGWPQLRWKAPVRNLLPLSLRRKKYEGRYSRPFVSTLLWLSRAFIDLQARAANDTRSQTILDDIERDCPRTLKAIMTRPRLDSALERAILEGAEM